MLLEFLTLCTNTFVTVIHGRKGDHSLSNTQYNLNHSLVSSYEMMPLVLFYYLKLDTSLNNHVDYDPMADIQTEMVNICEMISAFNLQLKGYIPTY